MPRLRDKHRLLLVLIGVTEAGAGEIAAERRERDVTDRSPVWGPEIAAFFETTKTHMAAALGENQVAGVEPG